MATGRILLTINIRRYLVGQPRTKRARKAALYIRERVAHYTKTKIEDVKISQELNNLILKRYSKSMSPVRINAKIENGKATAEPFAKDASMAADQAKPATDAAKKGLAEKKK
ncbi:MAG: hypothetical protein M1528_01465 [Candidatus Marsarchaeota archaeon]|nr:hypothetical protein [Candidatus Marsarchaeota archaeon]MCL5115185.1 hypothetical protein [Candidatus Marsarchaeota archaeon]